MRLYPAASRGVVEDVKETTTFGCRLRIAAALMGAGAAAAPEGEGEAAPALRGAVAAAARSLWRQHREGKKKAR